MKTIAMTAAATKEFFALPAKVQDQVDIALTNYALHGSGNIKALQGGDFYRLRVGRYRVIFDEDRNTILAVYIGKRETSTYRKGRL